MRLHVLWSGLYSTLILVDVYCTNITARVVVIAVVALLSFRSLWQLRQLYYEYGFEEGKTAMLDAFSAYVPAVGVHQRQQQMISLGESIQDAPAVHQPLP